MSPFFKLPVEVRNMIYSYCLAVRKVFPYPRPVRDERYVDFDSYEKPQLALLLVNKEVNGEAKQILFSKKNLYIIPRGFGQWMYKKDIISLLAPKSVSISFTFRDVGGHYNRFITSDSFEDSAKMSSRSLRGADQVAQLQLVHDSLRENLLELWSQKMKWLCSLPKMNHLELDMEEFCCPLGCCFGAELFSEFNDMEFDPVQWPRNVMVTGCKNAAVERALKLAVKAFQASSNLYAAGMLTGHNDGYWEGQEMDIDAEGNPSWVDSPLTMEEKMGLCQEIIDRWHAAPSAGTELIAFALALGATYL